MNIVAESTKPFKKKTSILCSYVLENSTEPLGLGKFDTKINSTIKEAVKETKGKVGEIAIIYSLGNTPAKKILIVGLGPKNKLSADVLRNVTGKVAQKVRSLGLSDFSIVSPSGISIDSDHAISAIVEGTMLSLYSFDKYKKEKSEKSPNLSILVSNTQNAQKII
ncbi:MAG TPA: M17 family peptidase N-terminal domain-containing protein, partial [Nitrosopumilaceae archaeon]|nr:M17 family peptidase N-terminal domain-containing protein [Nitrosopumilaceae archaeon]